MLFVVCCVLRYALLYCSFRLAGGSEVAVCSKLVLLRLDLHTSYLDCCCCCGMRMDLLWIISYRLFFGAVFFFCGWFFMLPTSPTSLSVTTTLLSTPSIYSSRYLSYAASVAETLLYYYCLMICLIGQLKRETCHWPHNNVLRMFIRILYPFFYRVEPLVLYMGLGNAQDIDRQQATCDLCHTVDTGRLWARHLMRARGR